MVTILAVFGLCRNLRITSIIWKFALKCFISERRNIHVQILIDNTTAVFYINNVGGIRCDSINTLSREMWNWAIARGIFISAVHISGQKNITDDFYSRNFNEGTEWSLHPIVFYWLCHSSFTPDIDLFPSRLNATLFRVVASRPSRFRM